MTDDVTSRLVRIEVLVGTIQTDQENLGVYLTRVLDDHSTRLRAMEIDNAAMSPRVETLSAEVTGLRKRANAWGAINTVLAAIAAALGWPK